MYAGTPAPLVLEMAALRNRAAREAGHSDYHTMSLRLQEKLLRLVEYGEFATAIDERIRTRCITCPPEDHPEEYYCGWEFRIAT